MSRSRSHSPATEPPGVGGGGGRDGRDDDEGGGGGGDGGPLVKVAFASHQVEAELLQGLLREFDIPSVLKRSRGFDNPDFLAAGPHDVYVRSELAEEAREVLANATLEVGADPEMAELEEQARVRRHGETSPGRLAFWMLAVLVGGLILAWILYQGG
jgi:hypothetical protein